MKVSEATAAERIAVAILEAAACDEGLEKHEILGLVEDARAVYLTACEAMQVAPEKTYT